ncbi:MAG: hypothetical protein K2W99_02890 [Chthoniobacterales bacterium]|nr:hypothetical protein [Chthoniobacterales bacterium]
MKKLSLLLLAGASVLAPLRVSAMMERKEEPKKEELKRQGTLEYSKEREEKALIENVGSSRGGTPEGLWKSEGESDISKGIASEYLDKETDSKIAKEASKVTNYGAAPFEKKEDLLDLKVLEQKLQEAREIVAELTGKGSVIEEAVVQKLFQEWSERYEHYTQAKSDFSGRENNGIADQQIEERLGELVEASQAVVEALGKSLRSITQSEMTRTVGARDWRSLIDEQKELFRPAEDKAVFWSGWNGGVDPAVCNLAKAKAYAAKKGDKVTLETTAGGTWLGEHYGWYNPATHYKENEANAVWRHASEHYLKQARGHVIAFIFPKGHPKYNGTSIYQTVEKPELEEKDTIFLSEHIVRPDVATFLTKAQQEELNKPESRAIVQGVLVWLHKAQGVWERIGNAEKFNKKENRTTFLDHPDLNVRGRTTEAEKQGEELYKLKNVREGETALLEDYVLEARAVVKTWEPLYLAVRALDHSFADENYIEEAKVEILKARASLLRAKRIAGIEGWKEEYEWLQEAIHTINYYIFKAYKAAGNISAARRWKKECLEPELSIDDVPPLFLPPPVLRVMPMVASQPLKELSHNKALTQKNESTEPLQKQDLLAAFEKAKQEAEEISLEANHSFFDAIKNQLMTSWELAQEAAAMTEASWSQVLEKTLSPTHLSSAAKLRHKRLLPQMEDQKKLWSQKNQFAQKKLSSLETHQKALKEPTNIHSLHTATTAWKELVNEHQLLLENYSITMTPEEREAWDQELQAITAEKESLQRFISETEKEPKPELEPEPALKPEPIATPEKRVQQEIFQRKAREAQQASQQALQRVRKYAWENNSDYASKDAVSAWQKVSFYWTQAAKSLEEGEDPFLLEAAAMEATKASQWYEESVKDGIGMLCQDWKLSSAARLTLESAKVKAEAAPWKIKQQEARDKRADAEARAWEEAIQLALKASEIYEEAVKQNAAGNTLGKGGSENLENAARSTLGSAKTKAETAPWKTKQQEAANKRADTEAQAWEEVLQLALKASELYEEAAKQFAARDGILGSDQGYNLGGAARSILESAKAKAEIAFWKAKQQEAHSKRANAEAQAWEEAIQLALQASVSYRESAEQFVINNGSTSRDKAWDLGKAAELVLESAKAKAEAAPWKTKQQEAYSKRANAEAQAWGEAIHLVLKASELYEEAAEQCSAGKDRYTGESYRLRNAADSTLESAKAKATLWKTKQQKTSNKRVEAEAKTLEEAIQLVLKASKLYEESAKQYAEGERNEGNNLSGAAKSTLELAKTKAEIIMPWKAKQQEASNKKVDIEAQAWEEAIKQALKASKLYERSAAGGYIDAIIKSRDEAYSILESAKAKAEAAPWKTKQQEAHRKKADAEAQAWEEAIQLTLKASELYEEAATYDGKYDFRRRDWWNTANSTLELARAKVAAMAGASSQNP